MGAGSNASPHFYLIRGVKMKRSTKRKVEQQRQWDMCKRKRWYKTEYEAQGAVASMEFQNSVTGLSKHGPLHPYLCPYCYRYHVGHSNPFTQQ